MSKPKTGKNKIVRRGRSLRLAGSDPYASHRNSELSWLWNRLKNGDMSLDDLAVTRNGITNVTRFYITLRTIADPLHPDNNWSSVVEELMYGETVYLRLAHSIPMPIVEYWKAHGHPPSAGWGFFSGLVGGKGSVVVDSAGRDPNPYPPNLKLHSIFAIANEWTEYGRLMARIAVTVYGSDTKQNRRRAANMWHEISRSDRNDYRSRTEERTAPDGSREVRAVAIKG